MAHTSDDEILRRMEQDLLSDAKFSERVREFGVSDLDEQTSTEDNSPTVIPTVRFSLRRLALAGLLVLLGFVLVFSGVTIGYSALGIAVGIAGILLMMGGVYLALSSSSRADSSRGGAASQTDPTGDSFADRQRRKFNERYKR